VNRAGTRRTADVPRGRRGDYRRLLSYAKPHWREWVLLLFVTVGATAMSLATPWPLQVLADNVLGGAAPTGLLADLPGASTPNGLLVWVAIGGLVIVVLAALLDALATRIWTHAGTGMVYELSGDMLDATQRRSLIFHSRHPVGDSMARITGDSWAVYDLFDAVIFGPLHSVLTTVGMILLMLRLDVQLTVVAVAAAPIMALSALLLGRPVREAGYSRREAESAMHAHVQQTLAGLSVVQAFTGEESHNSRFREVARDAIRAQRRTVLTTNLSTFGSGLVAAIGAGIVLLIGGHHVLDGRLSVGELLVFAAYLTALQLQLKSYASIYTRLQALRASVNRVMEVLDSASEVAELPGAPGLVVGRGHVRLEGVSFGYEADRAVLRGVSLEALPGETVAIVGPTGAGKSTLVGLVLRFFDPWSGSVSIDGQDLRDVQLASVRGQVALVLQESFLFPMSIADNIAYGRPGASPEEVVEAAVAANAHGFISRLPDGYDTVVGERGATLSGGERQRVAIARALLKDAPVLILDEPTSALDAETEGLLLEALERLMQGRTTLIIAHRLSTIRNADRIVVLQNGRVAETGTHRQLLDNHGLYARLQGMQ
jgi:ATP-binding cassette subfamily B protein/subfamily B ATP-binding cassette protein MsbA